MGYDLNRRLFAEALGTGILVAAVVGSGIMAETLTGDRALALLANTIPTGAILIVLITMLGPVSGAHFNPAVTLVFTLQGALAPGVALAYVAAQISGGLLGTGLAHTMFEMPLWTPSPTPRTGSGQWIAEAVASFGLIGAILGGLRLRPEVVPALVGLYITAAYWFTASTSFANPAVTLARALTDSFSGIRPADAPGFIVAQLIGATLAGAVFAWLYAPARRETA
ncbi:aquaporin [Paracoccus marinaquae]|nr:MIP/aquaporin family protein [Paracoccus marinaquae]